MLDKPYRISYQAGAGTPVTDSTFAEMSEAVAHLERELHRCLSHEYCSDVQYVEGKYVRWKHRFSEWRQYYIEKLTPTWNRVT